LSRSYLNHLVPITRLRLIPSVSFLMYKVVQIWQGLFVCKQVTVCPGDIWTTLYIPKFVLRNVVLLTAWSRLVATLRHVTWRLFLRPYYFWHPPVSYSNCHIPSFLVKKWFRPHNSIYPSVYNRILYHYSSLFIIILCLITYYIPTH
jgi:hypothetical protein